MDTLEQLVSSLLDESTPNTTDDTDLDEEMAEVFTVKKAPVKAITYDPNRMRKPLLYVTCNAGHTRSAGNDIVRRCILCDLVRRLNQQQAGIVALSDVFDVGQCSFEFMCPVGHRFTAGEKTCKFGCRSCSLLKFARKKHAEFTGRASDLQMDVLCRYNHELSKMRFHCNKLRHNPACENAECVAARLNPHSRYVHAPDCTDFIPCNQDFYATPMQIRNSTDVYACDYNHRWAVRGEVITLLKLFELYFSARFDDYCAEDSIIVSKCETIEFTGYNRALKLAFTHGSDKIPERCYAAAKQWCELNDVRFVYVPGNKVKASHIATSMMTQLVAFGLCRTNLDRAVMEIRTDSRKMGFENKPFVDRCVFTR